MRPYHSSFKSGSNTERNVQLLCMNCNRTKHAKIM
ncbi:MAG: HNH endonuclease [Halobacteriota archaeon]